MPKFLFPIVILSSLSLAGFGFVVLKMNPDQTISVILFLATLFLSLTFTLSLAFFFIHKRFFFRPKTFDAFGPVVSDDELHSLFRTSLRRAVLVAFLLTALLVIQRFL